MAGKPIATLGSMHVCPLCSGTVPHVGGPVTGPGAPNVLINGKPVAVMGDMCTCAGPPDTIVQGNPSVLINGVPVACAGDMTAHGGTITIGEANVLISTSKPNPKVTMPLKQIPFPKITVLDHVGAAMKGKSEDMKQAKKNQEEIKKEAENQNEEPLIYNLHWENMVNNSIHSENVTRKVKIVATVKDIPDGESVTVKVYKSTSEGKVLSELQGIVKNNRVEIEWDTEERHFNNNNC